MRYMMREEKKHQGEYHLRTVYILRVISNQAVIFSHYAKMIYLFIFRCIKCYEIRLGKTKGAILLQQILKYHFHQRMNSDAVQIIFVHIYTVLFTTSKSHFFTKKYWSTFYQKLLFQLLAVYFFSVIQNLPKSYQIFTNKTVLFTTFFL